MGRMVTMKDIQGERIERRRVSRFRRYRDRALVLTLRAKLEAFKILAAKLREQIAMKDKILKVWKVEVAGEYCIEHDLGDLGDDVIQLVVDDAKFWRAAALNADWFQRNCSSAVKMADGDWTVSFRAADGCNTEVRRAATIWYAIAEARHAIESRVPRR